MTIKEKFKTLSAWLSSDFTKRFGELEYEPSKRKLSAQTLPRDMTNDEIISELHVTEVTISEIVDYLASPEADREHWMRFYPKGISCVVHVHWDGSSAGWDVDTWWRDGGRWGAGDRVISPATESLKSMASDSVTLEDEAIASAELAAPQQEGWEKSLEEHARALSQCVDVMPEDIKQLQDFALNVCLDLIHLARKEMDSLLASKASAIRGENRKLLVQVHGMLSLLYYRGLINYETTGSPEKEDVEKLVGKLQRSYE